MAPLPSEAAPGDPKQPEAAPGDPKQPEAAPGDPKQPEADSLDPKRPEACEPNASTSVAFAGEAALCAGTPLTVTVVGPPELLAKVEAFKQTREGCALSAPWGLQGFSINWGDDRGGTREGYDGQPLDDVGCPDLLRHTYAVPGTYSIVSHLFHIGPTDAPVTEWEGAQVVTVNGPTAPLQFALGTGLAEKVWSYQARLDVGWVWAPDVPYALELSIVTNDGMVVHEQTLPSMAYVGEAWRGT
jgi:hypothetical protein